MDTDKDILTKLLLDAQDQHDSIRSVAEGKLKQRQEHDFPDFLLSLSAELLKDASPPDCRRLAGIILKNSVEGKYSEDNNLHIKQWINLDPLIKSQIKESLLTTLGSLVPDAWHASSQVIAKLAYIDIPSRDWQDLIGRLLGNMAQQGASPPLQQATLEALEYMFEDFLGLEQDKIDDVLDAIIRAMNRAEQSSQVRLAAVKALQNVVMFANFANDDCRNCIMTAICDAAKSDGAVIKHAAFGCLSAIASKYYRMLEPYTESILSLTTEALKGGVESGALQCIKFWITICEKVIELRKQNKHDAHAISTVDCSFIEKPLSLLVPVLLKTLLKKERDDDAQAIFISAMTCLDLVAITIGDAIVPIAMQFVEVNIKASDWQSRWAATFAIAGILQGPSIEKLSPVVRLLLDRMEDRNVEVRGTAVCTLRRMFDLLHSPACANRIFTDANLPRIVAVLAKRSEDVPDVSEEACRAIYFLAKGYESISSELGHSKKEISSELSPFLSDVFDVLFSTSAPAKETPFRLPTSASAYEALCEVVRVSNIQDYEAKAAIGVLMPCIMRRLNMVLDGKASSSGDKRNKYDLLVLLCDLLHVIIQKLGKSLKVATCWGFDGTRVSQ
jgi:importin subunit beta-1